MTAWCWALPRWAGSSRSTCRASGTGLSREPPRCAQQNRDLPPAVIAVAGHAPLRDEGVADAELRAAGVPVTRLEFPSPPHGFLRFTGPVPGAADASARIVVAAAALMEDRARTRDSQSNNYPTERGDHDARSRT